MKINNQKSEREHPVSRAVSVDQQKSVQTKMSNMKNQIINITSLTKGVRVTIRNGQRKLKARRFADIDSALEFVLPRGNRQTDLYLNGYWCMLNGWLG